jgi:hypothetical protein
LAGATTRATCRVSVPAGWNQHVDDLPVLVDRPVDVAPHAVDLDLRFVDVPSIAGRLAAEPGGVGQQRGEPPHPPVHGHLVDFDPSFETTKAWYPPPPVQLLLLRRREDDRDPVGYRTSGRLIVRI